MQEDKLVKFLSILEPKSIDVNEVIKIIDTYELNVKLFVTEAMRNRVLPQVYYNIQYIEEKLSVTKSFFYTVKRNMLANYSNIIDRNCYLNSLKSVISHILQIEKNVIFVKGVSLQNLYLNYTKTYRQMVDVDFLIQKIYSLWKFLISAKTLGYAIDNNVTLKFSPISFSENGSTIIPSSFIQLCYVTFYSKSNSPIMAIESKYFNPNFHKPYLLRTPFLENRQKILFGSIELDVPSFSDTTYLLIHHILLHNYIKLNWINDLYLLSSKTHLDWEYILNSFSKEGILPIFYNLLKYVERLYKYNLTSNLKQNYPKYFNNYKSSSAFWLLFKPIETSKPLKQFLIQSEIVRNRCRHRFVAYVILCMLFLKMLYSDLLIRFRFVFEKIKKIIIPLLIKCKYSLNLPCYYQINFWESSKPINDNIYFQINWHKKTGFTIACPFFIANERCL